MGQEEKAEKITLKKNPSAAVNVIRKRKAAARARGMSYTQYMHSRKRTPVYPRGTIVKAGRVISVPTGPRKGYYGPRKRPLKREWPKYRLFVRGSSMVGSPGPKKLLRFQPTKTMLASGFLPVSLRFHHREKARFLGLETRHDWITDMVSRLKGKGFLK